MESSDDDVDSESEIAEMVAFETAALASLRARDPELAVLNADGTLRCPLCSPSKKKQSYAYQDLLQHATAVAVGIRGPEAAGKHSALKLYLESDLASMATTSSPHPGGRGAAGARQTGTDDGALGIPSRPRQERQDRLVCPWSVVIVFCGGEEAEDEGGGGESRSRRAPFGKGDLKAHFREFRPERAQVLYGPEGHLGLGVLQFGRGFEGLNDALALEKHLQEEDRGRRDYERGLAAAGGGPLPGPPGFYGWVAREEDQSRGGGLGGARGEELARYLGTYGDLKDIVTAGDEFRRLHEQQVRYLSESLADKARESIRLRTEIDVLQRRAEADQRAADEECSKTGVAGSWTGCRIL